MAIVTADAANSVWGVPQHSYTVEGVAGQDFAAALTIATFKEATAIEAAAQSYTAIVKQRQQKVEDLGSSLSCIAFAISTMDPKSNDTGKKSWTCHEVYQAQEKVSKYGLSIGYDGVSYSSDTGGKAYITYRNATKAQNNIQYEMDKEDNELQQDIVALNSLMSKRDNAFSTAARIVRKAFNATATTIRNVGN